MKKGSKVFSEEEFVSFYRDLIKISRSFDDGFKFGYQELKDVIRKLGEKEAWKRKYTKVV